MSKIVRKIDKKDSTIPANILQVFLKRKFKHYEKSGSIPDFLIHSSGLDELDFSF